MNIISYSMVSAHVAVFDTVRSRGNLMTERMEQKGNDPAFRHYFRNFWLFLLGLAHAYLVWSGDILVPYALCSVWVFLFRKKSAKALFLRAGVFLTIKLSDHLIVTSECYNSFADEGII